MTRRQRAISLFVAVWLCVFSYETLRAGYLSPWAQHPLPKLPFLFPPAGWIMFYSVDRHYGFAEVYGVRGNRAEPIEPHRIVRTRSLGYDNLRRNILVGVLSRDAAPSFCAHLRRRFPGYEGFVVAYAQYPDVVAKPDRIERHAMYQCR